MWRKNTQKPRKTLPSVKMKGPHQAKSLYQPKQPLIVGCLSDVGCWDVTPLIESHNKELVWTALLIVHSYCNRSNNLAISNIKWRCGCCRNSVCTLWSGGNLNKASSHFANGEKQSDVVPLVVCLLLRLLSQTACIGSVILATKATERYNSHKKTNLTPVWPEYLFIL